MLPKNKQVIEARRARLQKVVTGKSSKEKSIVAKTSFLKTLCPHCLIWLAQKK